MQIWNKFLQKSINIPNPGMIIQYSGFNPVILYFSFRRMGLKRVHEDIKQHQAGGDEFGAGSEEKAEEGTEG